MVTGDAIHAGSGQRRTAEQVTAADHQADLHADTDQLADFQRHAIKHLGIDTEILGAHQGFAAKFEQNAFVTRLATSCLLSHCKSLLRRFEFCCSVCALRLSGMEPMPTTIVCMAATTFVPLYSAKRLHAQAGSLSGTTGRTADYCLLEAT